MTQYLPAPSNPLDLTRSASRAAFGAVATVWLHYWWGFLEAFVGTRVPVVQYRLQNMLIKVLVDQPIGTPICICSLPTM